MIHDLVIRGGLIVDGTGAPPTAGDVAIRDGRIAAVGEVKDGAAAEIDAAGCIVTPGFIDLHTHYDGQALWSHHIGPSSQHGVTTVLMGNCGVGFAPCRPTDRKLLVTTMEGVEDIPEVVMAEGLNWDWETFPEFMDALDRNPRDIDVAMLMPHTPLRIYAMGQRGADCVPAGSDDLVEMKRLVAGGMAAGALGFATSRIFLNRRSDGANIASYGADEQELIALTGAIGKGSGVLQLVLDLTETDEQMLDQIRMLGRIAGATKVPVTFSFVQLNASPDQWRAVLDEVARLNGDPDIDIRPQIFPRPLGMIAGLTLSANPFSLCPSYMAIADLPIAARVAEMRKPETRSRIVGEAPVDPTNPLVALARAFDYTYRLGDPIDYEPDPASSIAAIAAQCGVEPEEVAYDLLLEDGGEALLFIALGNYGYGTLDHFPEMLAFPGAVVGLGDGGAHYGMICDASYPTFMLTHWVSNRAAGRLPLERVVQSLSAEPAELMQLHDRGKIAIGLKADINVIDLDALRLHRPFIRHDLPSGAGRLDQAATGFRHILVAGQAIIENDISTGHLPGKLVRGVQAAA